MKLGTSVNAVTGELVKDAIDPASIVPEESDASDAGEHFVFQRFEDVLSLETSTSVSSSASVTFPVDGLNVSVSHGLDFSNSSSTQGLSLIYLLTWERVGKLQHIGGNVQLTAEAKEVAADKFRSIFGDYYVHQINTRAKFVAMWYVPFLLRCFQDAVFTCTHLLP